MPHHSELAWLQHESSTYTYVGRNDVAVNWVLQQKEKIGHNPCKKIIILGSGVIEPFTIAALPQAQHAQVIAVEIESDLVDLGNQIKSGKKVSWEEVAQLSRHPETINNQLLEAERIKKGLEKLKTLGSFHLLGKGVSVDSFQVPPALASRVSFVNSDSLTALRDLQDADVICDFFVQTNINKSGSSGITYTQELVAQAIKSLSESGTYLIGDTGYNHQNTLSHMATLAEARINAGSLVHIINKGDSFSSSWYIAISRGELLTSDDITHIRERVEALAQSTGLEIQEVRHTISELATDVNRVLYLAYVASEKEVIAWSTVDPLSQALLRLAGKPEDEFGATIVFPGKN